PTPIRPAATSPAPGPEDSRPPAGVRPGADDRPGLARRTRVDSPPRTLGEAPCQLAAEEGNCYRGSQSLGGPIGGTAGIRAPPSVQYPSAEQAVGPCVRVHAAPFRVT